MSEVPGRRNGFTTPYSKPQILAWLVLIITALQFLFFVSPLMPVAASIPVTIFFFCFIVAIFYYGYLTQAIDPADAHLRKFLAETQPDDEEKQSKIYKHINPLPNDFPDEPMKQCWLCDIKVAEPSMHCKFCNKCVKNFDHHCMWLNTCIGRDNYQYFFRTMICIFVMQMIHIIIQIVLVVDISRGGSTLDLANSWFNAENGVIAVQVVLIFFIVFDGISMFLIGQLLWFHILLQRENLTTYAYIVRESNKRRDKMRLYGEIHSQRMEEITKAKAQGRSVDVCKLRVGALCRIIGCLSCDPVDTPELSSDPEYEFSSSIGAVKQQQEDEQETVTADAATPPPSSAEPRKSAHSLTSNGNGETSAQTKDMSDATAADDAQGSTRSISIGVGFVPVEAATSEQATETLAAAVEAASAQADSHLENGTT